MPLPVLNYRNEPTSADLVRLFHQTETRLTEHLAEGEVLEMGTAYANAQLREVDCANNIRDVALADGMIPAQALEAVDRHYAERGSRCTYWTMNPSAPELRTRPMVEYLMSRKYRTAGERIMLLGQMQGVRVPVVQGVKVVPARASFRHTRELLAQSPAARAAPALLDAAELHLDDPHWDALIALADGKAVAHIGVLAMGEVGRIETLYVAETHRRRGLGTMMLARALEICARSLFRHVMVSVAPGNEPAIGLYERFGFGAIGK